MTHLVHFDPLLFEAGDRFAREEFLARWERMPALKFAELIDGVVYLPSPVPIEHARRDHILQVWTGVYASHSGVVEVLANGTWLMAESAPQPDVALRLRPECGGQSRDMGKYPAGAPEFMAEVCGSTRSYDLGPKLALYERAGVREYLAVLLEERRLEWRVLGDRGFEMILAEGAGIWRSPIFPGLWLDEMAFWRGDVPGVLAVLEQGIHSAEFARFRERQRAR
jgi:Uma2 family endonuclease